MEDMETCSRCLDEVPWAELENHTTKQGENLCNPCWRKYLSHGPGGRW